MSMDRRSFIKTNAVAAAAATAGVTIPGVAMAKDGMDKDNIRWDKAACRFCGTGCSVLVGTKEGRVVATQGDPDAPVNKASALTKVDPPVLKIIDPPSAQFLRSTSSASALTSANTNWPTLCTLYQPIA